MANSKSLWLRLYTEILNDPKVQRLPDSLFRAYINFLCIAKEYSNDGVLPPKKDIAFFLRCPEKTVEKLCDGLQKNELLDAGNDTFSVHGWNNRQYESDNDPTANVRKQRQRERDKTQNVTGDVTDVSRVTSRTCHENVTRTETETETETEEDKKKRVCRPQYSDSFLAFYDSYPKQEGKKQAQKTYNAITKQGVAHDAIMASLAVYKAQIAAKHTETQYIKLPATFLNCFEDYAPKPAPARPRSYKYVFRSGFTCTFCHNPLPAGTTICPKCFATRDTGLPEEMFLKVEI
jgi:hypothetical protein